MKVKFNLNLVLTLKERKLSGELSATKSDFVSFVAQKHKLNADGLNRSASAKMTN